MSLQCPKEVDKSACIGHPLPLYKSLFLPALWEFEFRKSRPLIWFKRKVSEVGFSKQIPSLLEGWFWNNQSKCLVCDRRKGFVLRWNFRATMKGIESDTDTSYYYHHSKFRKNYAFSNVRWTMPVHRPLFGIQRPHHIECLALVPVVTA